MKRRTFLAALGALPFIPSLEMWGANPYRVFWDDQLKRHHYFQEVPVPEESILYLGDTPGFYVGGAKGTLVLPLVLTNNETTVNTIALSQVRPYHQAGQKCYNYIFYYKDRIAIVSSEYKLHLRKKG